MLNRFFSVVISEVDARGGLVNKFMGDAALAIFGAPVEHDDHATAALASARAMADRLRVEVPEIGFGVGVSTGEVVAGNLGDETRLAYTEMGAAVKSAGHLTDLSTDIPGDAPVTADTVAAATAHEANNPP